MYAPEELLLVLGWRRDVVPRCCPGAGVLEGRWLRCSRATSSTLLPSLGPLAFVWLILKIVIVAARVAHPPRPATALVVVRLLKSSPDAHWLLELTSTSSVPGYSPKSIATSTMVWQRARALAPPLRAVQTEAKRSRSRAPTDHDRQCASVRRAHAGRALSTAPRSETRALAATWSAEPARAPAVQRGPTRGLGR